MSDIFKFVLEEELRSLGSQALAEIAISLVPPLVLRRGSYYVAQNWLGSSFCFCVPSAEMVVHYHAQLINTVKRQTPAPGWPRVHETLSETNFFLLNCF